MGHIAALLSHAVCFWSLACWFASPTVLMEAWMGLYFAGTVALLVARRFSAMAFTTKQWGSLLFYAIFLAALFFGADSGLAILGNSVKPRAPPPAGLGGLTLPLLLLPGVAAVAVGALAERAYAAAVGRFSTHAPDV